MDSWHQLERAATAGAVVAIVRDYVALWSPEEIAMLPPGARPGRMRDELDVLDLHDRLVDAYRTTRACGDELAALQRIMGFLVQASLRIAKLHSARAA